MPRTSERTFFEKNQKVAIIHFMKCQNGHSFIFHAFIKKFIRSFSCMHNSFIFCSFFDFEAKFWFATGLPCGPMTPSWEAYDSYDSLVASRDVSRPQVVATRDLSRNALQPSIPQGSHVSPNEGPNDRPNDQMTERPNDRTTERPNDRTTK